MFSGNTLILLELRNSLVSLVTDITTSVAFCVMRYSRMLDRTDSNGSVPGG
jgi:hypothetical protein